MNRSQLILFCLLAPCLLSCGDESTRPDTTPPASITDLRVRTTVAGFHLRWTAPGDDNIGGQAARYAVRYAASDLASGWESAFVVPSAPAPRSAGHIDSVSVLGIGKGPWEFGIKTADEAGNWSGLSNIVTAGIDTIPPSAITDLSVRSTARGFYLRWTAPTDNGSTGRATRYDVRYALSNLVGTWGTAFVAPATPVPGIPGHADSASVLGIGWGPWEFGVKAADETGNWSTLSNIVTTTIPEDTEPPGPVTDLAVDFITEASVVLRWTATGDDGAIGHASAYDVRYAQAPITAETWAVATRVPWVGTPHGSGERELFTVPGLQTGPTYYFALQVLDEIENGSDVSNQVNAAVSSPVQLTFSTNQESGATRPDWSPDGQRIVFDAAWQTQPYPTQEIYIIPATGGAAVRYTSFPDGAAQASWSPDGTKWAFNFYVDERTRTVLALMDAQPGAASVVLADPGLPWKYIGRSRWSPDGTRIAFSASTFAPGYQMVSQMYKVASTGGVPEVLAGDGSWHISGLDWSPDGTQIVYSSNETGTYHLWRIPSGGGTATQLPTGAGEEGNPSWSPDGSKIAYSADGQIWVIYASGEFATQVTFDSDKRPGGKVAWSPDGGAIAFSAYDLVSGNIWILRIR